MVAGASLSSSVAKSPMATSFDSPSRPVMVTFSSKMFSRVIGWVSSTMVTWARVPSISRMLESAS